MWLEQRVVALRPACGHHLPLTRIDQLVVESSRLRDNEFAPVLPEAGEYVIELLGRAKLPQMHLMPAQHHCQKWLLCAD